MSTQTILVVDDDPQIRDVLSMALERAGFEAVLARDGAEGLTQAKAINPALADAYAWIPVLLMPSPAPEEMLMIRPRPASFIVIATAWAVQKAAV